MFNVNEIASRVADMMVGKFDANVISFLDDDDFESVYEACFDIVTAPANLYGERYTKLYEAVAEHPEIKLAYDACKVIQTDARMDAQDAMLLASDPNRYYGVSNADFL
jgi:hypothetical protein